jgi:streptogramin lyase
MWFSDLRGVAIGRITPSGQIAEFDAPQFSDEVATGIAFGSDGTPWFITAGSQPLLAHLTASGKVRASRIPSHLSPDGSLASDAGGNLWFVATDRRAKAVMVERLPQGNLVRTPARLNQELTPCCPNVAPKRLVIGPDGHPWFTTLHYGYKRSGAAFIGTVGASGVTLLKVTRKGVHYAAYPSGLAQGSESLWFTGSDPLMNNGVLWRTDVRGNQIAYDLPYDPVGLALDGNGNPWFTAFWSGLPSQIVKVTGLR